MSQNNDFVAVPELDDKLLEEMASVVPGMLSAEEEALFREWVPDVELLPTGEFESLVYGDDLVYTGSNPSSSQRNATRKMRKGISWSEEEEGLFMEALTKFGKGRWNNILKTRTPVQVASHTQKFFRRFFAADNKKPKSNMPRRHRKSSKVSRSHLLIPTTSQISPQRQGCEAPVFAPDQFKGEQKAPNFSSLPPCRFDPQVHHGALVPDPSHPLQRHFDQTEQQADQDDPPSNPGGYFDQERHSSIFFSPIPAPSHQQAPTQGLNPTPCLPHQHQQGPCPGMDRDRKMIDDLLEQDYLDFLSSLPDLVVL